MLRYDRIAHNGVALRSCWIGLIREVAGSVRSGKLLDRKMLQCKNLATLQQVHDIFLKS